jgi:hypothetical protein
MRDYARAIDEKTLEEVDTSMARLPTYAANRCHAA